MGINYKEAFVIFNALHQKSNDYSISAHMRNRYKKCAVIFGGLIEDVRQGQIGVVQARMTWKATGWQKFCHEKKIASDLPF